MSQSTEETASAYVHCPEGRAVVALEGLRVQEILLPTGLLLGLVLQGAAELGVVGRYNLDGDRVRRE